MQGPPRWSPKHCEKSSSRTSVTSLAAKVWFLSTGGTTLALQHRLVYLGLFKGAWLPKSLGSSTRPSPYLISLSEYPQLKQMANPHSLSPLL